MFSILYKQGNLISNISRSSPRRHPLLVVNKVINICQPATRISAYGYARMLLEHLNKHSMYPLNAYANQGTRRTYLQRANISLPGQDMVNPKDVGKVYRLSLIWDVSSNTVTWPYFVRNCTTLLLHP